MEWMLPLETLPGWPEAPAFSPAHLLLIALILPLATGIVIALLAWAPTWFRRTQSTGREVAPQPTHGSHGVED